MKAERPRAKSAPIATGARPRGSLQRMVRRWVAMHTAWSTRAEYAAGWRFVRDRQSISIFIKVRGMENAKWLARALNELEALRMQTQQDTQYAKSIAVNMAKHWQDTSPDWSPFDDIGGILTQIDNMAAGMERKSPNDQAQRPGGEGRSTETKPL